MTLREALATPFAWPGGYHINALMGDGGTLCHDCLGAEAASGNVHTSQCSGDDPAWRFVDGFVHWEGDPIQCDNCNKELPSEYGETE